MAKMRIRSSAGSYDVHCAPGALRQTGARVARLRDSSGVFVLSSARVWRHWGARLTSGIRGWRAKRAILFDDREAAKRLSTVEQICRGLVRAGADRHSVVVALGGGVVGDVAGLVAATYLRGVRIVQVPTTLVAQVDSSIGGKTGVNLPEGKNMIGAFYPPALVIVDPEALRTLPHREYRSGLYEVVKYGVIADRKLFSYLERHMLGLLRRDPAALERAMPRCIRIKAHIVEKDERESGLRQILNFGHTLGHALETATGYRRFLHGEAIGWGMMAATLLGLATNRLGEAEAERIFRLVVSIGPLPSLAGIRASDLRAILAGDKKSRGGRVGWVLPHRIGKVEWGIEVPWAVVARAFKELPAMALKTHVNL
jgi:3-dehydroquinate synthase